MTRVREPILTARVGLCAAILLSFGLEAGAQESGGHWNRFRGPNGQGIAEQARIPVEFGPESNVLWKTAVPPGKSSPVIWGDRIFLTAFEPGDKKTLVTLAADRTNGTILWRQAVHADKEPRVHAMNGPAAPTPAADAKHVYAYFGTYGLVCYDREGRKVWERRLETPKNHFGVATSPVLHGGRVIMVLDDNSGTSRLFAVSCDTGETAWEQPRSLFRAGWSTPMVWSHDGVDELVVLGYKRLTAYNPATGEEVWWLGGFSEETVGVPVAGEGLLFASAAALAGRGDKERDPARTWKIIVEEFDRNRDNQIQRGEMTKGFTIPLRPELARDNPGWGLPTRDMDWLMRFFDKDKNQVISEAEWLETVSGFAAHSQPNLAAVRPGARGDARPTRVAWEVQRGIPETPSPLYWKGRLYLLRDGGVLTCLEASTGRELFRERIGAVGQYIASPVVAGGRIVAASARGVVTLIEAGDELKVLARNPFDERIYATPAVAGDRLYLRTAGHLYAFGEPGRAE